MKFQKLTITLTLTCLCVFSIIGLVLNLDATLQHYDGDNYSGGADPWTLGAHSYSASSGACAFISPKINGAGNPQAAVDHDFHGWGTAWAKRDGYLSFAPWHWFKAYDEDSGPLKAILKVEMGTFTLNKKTVSLTIGGSLFKVLKLTRTLKLEFGGNKVIKKLVKVEEKYVGRYAAVGGGEDVSKSSGVCGIFDGVPFDHDTDYAPNHTH